ncbi:MAG: DUF3990 domain-containing protein [Bacteroides sp.]|nr:DUF3990 domain-containing protein [Bacteroides sp.]MCM1085690.1 DUF3990 domain-containing protein [Bacteroides sp.]
MILYHGSNLDIKSIDLSFSKKGKDFGIGFYLNDNLLQAQKMAERTTSRMATGTATVSAFEFDETCLHAPNGLNVKIFEDYSVEWAQFVLENRKNKTGESPHPYDIVVGPIANDTVGVQIRRFLMGILSIEDLIKELRFNADRAVQYFFGSEKAIALLKKISL